MKKKPPTSLQQKLSQCVGKICAYRKVEKEEEARQWACLLVDLLQREKLYPTTKQGDTK